MANSQDSIDNVIKKLAKEYNDTNFLDAERYGSILPDKNMVKAGMETSLANVKTEKLNVRDMEETKVQKRTSKKVSGVHDIKMLVNRFVGLQSICDLMIQLHMDEFLFVLRFEAKVLAAVDGLVDSRLHQ